MADNILCKQCGSQMKKCIRSKGHAGTQDQGDFERWECALDPLMHTWRGHCPFAQINSECPYASLLLEWQPTKEGGQKLLCPHCSYTWISMEAVDNSIVKKGARVRYKLKNDKAWRVGTFETHDAKNYFVLPANGSKIVWVTTALQNQTYSPSPMEAMDDSGEWSAEHVQVGAEIRYKSPNSSEWQHGKLTGHDATHFFIVPEGETEAEEIKARVLKTRTVKVRCKFCLEGFFSRYNYKIKKCPQAPGNASAKAPETDTSTGPPPSPPSPTTDATNTAAAASATNATPAAYAISSKQQPRAETTQFVAKEHGKTRFPSEQSGVNDLSAALESAGLGREPSQPDGLDISFLAKLEEDLPWPASACASACASEKISTSDDETRSPRRKRLLLETRRAAGGYKGTLAGPIKHVLEEKLPRASPDVAMAMTAQMLLLLKSTQPSRDAYIAYQRRYPRNLRKRRRAPGPQSEKTAAAATTATMALPEDEACSS